MPLPEPIILGRRGGAPLAVSWGVGGRCGLGGGSNQERSLRPLNLRVPSYEAQNPKNKAR